MKVLMVCLGNICRSPIAEGVLRAKFLAGKFNGTVDSAGVIGFHSGEAPDKRAIAIAEKYKIDISKQSARKFKASDFDAFDLILTMDQSVHREIMQMANHQNKKDKVALFLEYAGIAPELDVPDPYYGGPDGFEQVFKMIDEGCEMILKKINNSVK